MTTKRMHELRIVREKGRWSVEVDGTRLVGNPSGLDVIGDVVQWLKVVHRNEVIERAKEGVSPAWQAHDAHHVSALEAIVVPYPPHPFPKMSFTAEEAGIPPEGLK